MQAEVIHEISIEKAQFTVNADREALLSLVDRLFTSRPGPEDSPHISTSILSCKKSRLFM